MSSHRGGLKLITLPPGCGYGDAGCEYAAGLDALGIAVSWLPTHGNSADPLSRHRATTQAAAPIRARMSELYARDIDVDAFLLNVPPFHWHEHWLQAEPHLRPYCHLAWEVEQMPESWRAPLNRFDKVFVPSRFNRDALINGGVTAPVSVIPFIAREIDSDYDNDNDSSADFLPRELVRAEDFVFYTIGTWITRKDMETTIRAYLDAFTAQDPVVLVVKTSPLDEAAHWRQSHAGSDSSPHTLGSAWSLARLIAGQRNAPRIHLVTEFLQTTQIDQLHRRGDCFVSLTHSEGWGLGPFDAALHGNPVIVTGWGGQLDYLGADYPLLVDFELRPTLEYPDDGCFMRQPDVLWAQANRAHASTLMRDVVAAPSSLAASTKALAGELRSRYCAQRVCSQLAREMEML